MNLPKEKILINSTLKKEFENLIEYADKSLKEREAIWTPFLSAQVIEELKNKFDNLYDISCIYDGGFPSAERQRICFFESEKETSFTPLEIPIKGIYIKGNFLFDRATKDDFRKAIEDLGEKADPKAKADVEAGIDALREVLSGEDIEAISSKSAELSQLMMKMGEAAYQAESDSETEKNASPKDEDETVVDAEFEEVDAEEGNTKKAGK